MAKIQIKSRFTDIVIFEYDVDDLKMPSIREAVEAAVTTGAARLIGANLYEADLTGACLIGANLYKANLTRANLTRANLTRAHLIGANLTGANLYEADLTGACLIGANLYEANLAGADLTGANLYEADLTGADLTRARLIGANLAGADLTRAHLIGANLDGADLAGANLTRANLDGCEQAPLIIARTRILPEGDLIGWKKCENGEIVKLRIPRQARRSHAFGRKCRAEFVDVLEVIGASEGVTDSYGPRTTYRVGERVMADSWDQNWMDECSHGIHFFITREEAEAY